MRLPVWLASVVAVFVGTEFAHSVAYRVAHPDAGAREQVLAASGHGYLDYAPLAGALLAAIALVALLLRLGEARSGAPAARVPALPFALLVPLAFAFQEHLERFAHDGSVSFATAAEPAFVLGLWLQAPFAVIAWFAARSLLSVADAVGRALAAPPSRVEPAVAALVALLAVDLPRLRALATCRAGRGPPSAA
jgi:hypothetical protein